MDVVAGRHFSWNRSESKKGLQRSDLKSSSSKVEKLLGLELWWWRLWLLRLAQRRRGK